MAQRFGGTPEEEVCLIRGGRGSCGGSGGAKRRERHAADVPLG